MRREPRGEHRQRRDPPLLEPGLDRVAVHHLAVAQHVGAADVDRGVHVGVHARRAEQVVQHVAHGDRLDAIAHPLRRRHVRQHLGQVAHHLERRGARPDDHAGLQHERRHAAVEQDLPDLDARAQVRRELGVFGVQAAEVHDAADGRRSRGLGHGGGRCPIGALEALAGAHRVHEVVEDVDVSDRLADRRRVGRVAFDDLDAAPPVERSDPVRIAREHADAIAAVEQSRHEPTTEVAGRPQNESERLGAVRSREGAQRLFPPGGGGEIVHPRQATPG